MDQQFVVFFMDKHSALIEQVIKKYLIPNRYNIEDIKQYISEKIIQILTNRSSSNNPIDNPENYFKSCLDYYCIEYQRMHGYIFNLPRRPRKNCTEDEVQIKSYGFKYIDDLTIEEANSLQVNYEDDIVNNLDKKHNESSVWKTITDILTVEESRVLECIYIKNMTWNETSTYLQVPQSTCWFRKNRAMQKIYDACLNLSGSNIEHNLRQLLRGNVSSINQND